MKKLLFIIVLVAVLVAASKAPAAHGGEATQAIAELFGYLRPAGEDLIVLKDGSILRGTLLDEVIEIVTPYKNPLIPVRKCAGMAFSAKGFDTVVAINCNRLTGIVYTREFRFRESGTVQVKDVRKEDIKYVLLKSSVQEGPSMDSVLDATVFIMANGDILSGRPSSGEIDISQGLYDLRMKLADMASLILDYDSGEATITDLRGEVIKGKVSTKSIDLKTDMETMIEDIYMNRISEIRMKQSGMDVQAIYRGSGSEAWDGASVADNEEDGPSLAVRIPGSSVELKMRLILAGSFTMGSTIWEAGRDSDEGPQHQVTITKPFYMGTYEVTQAQWEAVMGTRPSYFGYSADLPVERVSWEDCQKFITKLNTMGLGTYRLPTEAEWEYACRVGSTTRFPWGNDSEYSELGQYAWYNDNSADKTHPVGQKKPNAWGLYDMHGNVWEWCSDRYGEYSSGAQTDPQGPATGSRRVLRGGGWYSFPQYCRSAFRSGYTPTSSYDGVGFRLVRTTP